MRRRCRIPCVACFAPAAQPCASWHCWVCTTRCTPCATPCITARPKRPNCLSQRAKTKERKPRCQGLRSLPSGERDGSSETGEGQCSCAPSICRRSGGGMFRSRRCDRLLLRQTCTAMTVTHAPYHAAGEAL